MLVAEQKRNFGRHGCCCPSLHLNLFEKKTRKK
jgi:hypothetical protein